MNFEVMSALNELEKERGITKEIILEAIEAAITTAYKRNYGTAQNVRVEVDDNTGEINVYARKVVVDEVTDESTQISLQEAQAIDPNYKLDDVIDVEVTPEDFGRIAAQTAKQVVIQRIREAERALIYDEFKNREGDVVTGIVQRRENRNVIIDLGKTEAVLAPSDQIPGEPLTQGTRIKVYISEVRQTGKGPHIAVSRTHPGLVLRLFEMEVPEIYDGTVEIKAVAREAGARTKVAVYSRDPNVDPVGACVGPRGMRVQAVVSELRGEKIDIIPWAPIEEEFVANALSPAHVVKTYLDESTKTARAVVPDNHLSLAIGKEGQNARLAARLTGWRIDIKSQEQMAQILAKEAFERATPKDDEIEDILEQDRLPAQEPEIGAVDAANRDELEETEIDTIGEEDEFAAAVRGQDLDQETVVHEPQELEHLEELPLEEDLEDEVPVYADEDSEPLEPTAVDDDLDDDLDELDDLEEESGDVEPELDDDSLWRKRTPKPAAVLGKAKSRKTRKQDLESLLEEELTEEEPLPTLFSGDEQQDEVEVYVAGPQDDESGFTLAGRLDLKDIKLQGDDDKGKKKGKGKKTLKDLADLRWEFDE
ncbi:MAG: transcription termination/antitermination protein NusA [Firmicutes bacterium]|nr:transcription termination/antitermination protein NusA [Bacillota bacterium]